MSAFAADQVWFQTDDAWDSLPEEQRQALARIDVREEARGLRFITSAKKIDAFIGRHRAEFRPYTLFGSGDFHHLTAVWTRQFTEPFTILSFDNHPDWDIRPPRWSCGAWVNRALENPLVERIAIWGCGNFECNFPGRLLGNRTAAREGRLLVHPWAQAGRNYPDWLWPMRAATWREEFSLWLESISGRKVYVTLDLDCLAEGHLFTNWEAGAFTCNDIEWAIKQLRMKTQLIGSDLCGAWSKPVYATSFQRLAGWFDHPKVQPPEPAARAESISTVFSHLWPALTGRGSA
jgi:arginase family enzyme